MRDKLSPSFWSTHYMCALCQESAGVEDVLVCREACCEPEVAVEMIRRSRSSDEIEVYVDAHDGKSLFYSKRPQEIGMPSVDLSRRLGGRHNKFHEGIRYGTDHKLYVFILNVFPVRSTPCTHGRLPAPSFNRMQQLRGLYTATAKAGNAQRGQAREYLIKWKGRSYEHCSWISSGWLKILNSEAWKELVFLVLIVCVAVEAVWLVGTDHLIHCTKASIIGTISNTGCGCIVPTHRFVSLSANVSTPRAGQDMGFRQHFSALSVFLLLVSQNTTQHYLVGVMCEVNDREQIKKDAHVAVPSIFIPPSSTHAPASSARTPREVGRVSNACSNVGIRPRCHAVGPSKTC